MEGREALRTAKAAAEAEWKETKAKHQQALDIWKLDCERLQREKVLVKDLPPKPKCPWKPKPVSDELDVQPGPSEEPVGLW